jgi:hypothetical protein
VLVGEIGVGRCDGLELDEGSEMLHIVEVDSHALPEEQVAALGYGDGEADGRRESGEQGAGILHLDDVVSALALLRFIGALELDKVRQPWVLLTQLETAIALPDRASVLGVECSTCLDRTLWG